MQWGITKGTQSFQLSWESCFAAAGENTMFPVMLLQKKKLLND